MANATQGDLTTVPEIIPFLEDKQEFEDGTYALIEQRVSGVYRQEVFQPLQEGSGVGRQVVVNSDKTPSRIFEVFKRLFVKTPPNAAESTQAGADAAAVSADYCSESNEAGAADADAVSADQMEEEFPDETPEPADRGRLYQGAHLTGYTGIAPGVEEALKTFFEKKPTDKAPEAPQASEASDPTLSQPNSSASEGIPGFEDDIIDVEGPRGRLLECLKNFKNGTRKDDKKFNDASPRDFVLTLGGEENKVFAVLREDFVLDDSPGRVKVVADHRCATQIVTMEMYFPGIGCKYVQVFGEEGAKDVEEAIITALEVGNLDFLEGLSYVMFDK